jgi:hypothetical protein
MDFAAAWSGLGCCQPAKAVSSEMSGQTRAERGSCWGAPGTAVSNASPTSGATRVKPQLAGVGITFIGTHSGGLEVASPRPVRGELQYGSAPEKIAPDPVAPLLLDPAG